MAANEVEHVVEELRKELHQLREELRSIREAVGVEDGNVNKWADLAEKVRAGAAALRDKSGEAVDRTRQCVTERPLVSIMTALAAGLVIGRFMPRNGKSE